MFHPYGLIVGAACVIGYLFVLRACRFSMVRTSLIDELSPWVVIAGVVGARLYHVVTDWHLYSGQSLFAMIAIWNGGIGVYGALLGGLVGILLFVLRKAPVGKRGLLFFSLADTLVFGVPVAQAIGRWGNFVNGELYGSVTSLPWGIMIAGESRHPLFWYESILSLLLFVFLWYLGSRRLLVFGKGQYFSIYGAGYALIRFWLEFLREETARPIGILSLFSIAQWVSLCVLLTMLGIFWTRRHAPKKAWDLSLS